MVNNFHDTSSDRHTWHVLITHIHVEPSPLILQCHDLRLLTVNHATITHDPRSQLFLTAAEPIVEFVFPRNWLLFETIAHPRNSHRFVSVIARKGRKEGRRPLPRQVEYG